MKSLVALLLAFTAATAAAGPIRVLYLGKDGTPSSKHCAALMQELGRDAIWFDYASDPAAVTRSWLAKFDAVLLDAPAEGFAELGAADAERIVKLEFPSDEKGWLGSDFIKAAREKILTAAGGVRRAEWDGFLAQREPERRSPNPNVANYERRPEALTFQEPMSVGASMQRTQTPIDLRLELFASEPEIGKPIAFAWDERGRLWLAETRDYPHVISENGEGHDAIKICEDTDGDGRADKFTVFADKLNLPTSMTFSNGGVIVAEPPRFLFLKDTDDDGRADVREVLMEGWGIRDTHAQASNLHWGYDNWVHGCVGYSGFKGTVGGKTHDFQMGTYRFQPDGSALEFLHQFTNNAWAHSQNSAGDDFGGTANNAPLFYGGIPQRMVPAGMKAMTAKKINVEDKAHAITPNHRQVDVFGGYTAAAGSAFIYSAKLPPRLQGMAMVCEPTMKLIALMDVQPDGAGYTAKDAFNLVASSDEWMSPVFAEVGPDGAVWFADWQNFIIQHNPTPSRQRGGYDAKTGAGGAHENPLRDHARGRIYRVVWKDAREPAKVQSLEGLSSRQMVAALGSDLQERRLTAQRMIVQEADWTHVDEGLRALVTANDGSVAAIHALWALEGLDRLNEPTVKAAMSAKDPALRRTAVRVLPPIARSYEMLIGGGVLSDPDPTTRLAALVKLGEFPTTPELKDLVAKLAQEPAVQADEWLKEAARVLVRKHKAITYKEGPNLLPNPGFEMTGAHGLPEGWKRRDYGSAPGNKDAEWRMLAAGARSGKQSVRCITRAEADTSLYADVPLKPRTRYRLSAWIKTHGFRGKASLNSHGAGVETERITDRESDWSEVETFFESGERTRASINLLHVAKGDSWFDDVKLCEVIGDTGEEKLLTADPKRGEQIFYKHPAVACVLCHALKGQGSTVGPALDGIAARTSPAFLRDSLLEPNKVLAKGFEHIGASPMPPMGLILKPQELEDIQAFLHTLK